MKKMKRYLLTSFLIIFITSISYAQQETTEYTKMTFYANRIINGHSVDLTPHGKLDFKIGHRMGRVDQLDNFFGIDQATSRIALEYGATEWCNIGVGRNTTEKLVDGFIKIKFLKQSKGKRRMPITVTGLSAMGLNTLPDPSVNTLINDYYFTNRITYAHQILIARRFGDLLSLQLSPTLIHRNLVQTKDDINDVFALGVGGRLKLSHKIDLTSEWYYVFPNQVYSQYNGTDVVNSFSLGIDIYTGKHTFQLHITNSTTMAEKGFITETTERWDKGQIHIGFNLLRFFTIANY